MSNHEPLDNRFMSTGDYGAWIVEDRDSAYYGDCYSIIIGKWNWDNEQWYAVDGAYGIPSLLEANNKASSLLTHWANNDNLSR